MIDITRLYCGEKTAGEEIRYAWRCGHKKNDLKTALSRKPVVVWNITRSCNLSCLHCYSDSEKKTYPDELSTQEGLNVIRDLADFKIASLLFSGGEPLLREDLFKLAKEAIQLKIRTTLSTNGILITKKIARQIKDSGFVYVGISLDGIGSVHDRFRGVKGAFEKTLKGIRHCKEVGQKVGLRLTLTRHTVENLEEIFQLMVDEEIDRACFYHLVFTGRGRFLKEEALTNYEVRDALQNIFFMTKKIHSLYPKKEILTVGHPADGVLLYLKLKEEGQEERAAQVLETLNLHGGGRFGSGVGIGCIDFNGNVHPDQFWMDETLGQVRERPFSKIWTDLNHPLLRGLKDRLPLLKGRCGICRWKKECGGGLRIRARLAFGDDWAEDPGCYLSDQETRPEAILSTTP